MSTEERLYELPVQWNNPQSGPTTILWSNLFGGTPDNYTVDNLDNANATVDYIETIGPDGTRYKTVYKVNGKADAHDDIKLNKKKHVKNVALIKLNDTDYIAVPEYDDHDHKTKSHRHNGSPLRTRTVHHDNGSSTTVVTLPLDDSRLSPSRRGTVSPRNGNRTVSPRSIGQRNGNRTVVSPTRRSTVSPRNGNRTVVSPTRLNGNVSPRNGNRTVVSPTRLNGNVSPRNGTRTVSLNGRNGTDIIAFIPRSDIIDSSAEVTRINADATIPSFNTFGDLVQDGPVLLTYKNGDLQVNRIGENLGQEVLQSINNMGSYVANLLNDAGTNIANLLQPVQQQSQGFFNGLLTTLGLNNSPTSSSL